MSVWRWRVEERITALVLVAGHQCPDIGAKTVRWGLSGARVV
jgi:hypothetical protein